MMMIFFLIESLYEIVHGTTYIPSTIVEEITKTSNDRFFWPCQNIFHFHIIFHTEMEKCSDRADHTAPILFLGVLTLIFVWLCVFGANFSEAKSALVLIFTLFSMSVSINIFYAYFKFEDEVPQYAKLIVFDETGMWSKVTMRGSAKGLVSHWSDRQN